MVSPHAIRTMSTAQLRSLLFRGDAPEFIESWVEGPTRRSPYLSVELATRPRATPYLSLCIVEVGFASFRLESRRQTEDGPLAIEPGRIVTEFILESDDPSLSRATAQTNPCSEVSALFPDGGPGPVVVRFDDGNNTTLANVDAARLGFAALRAAKEAAGRLKPNVERCNFGFTDIPLACNAPGDFVKTRMFRDISRIDIMRCATGAWCVDVTIARRQDCDIPYWAGPCGEDHLFVETDLRALEDGEMLDGKHIRSITVRAGGNPIV